ncbi:hypothetical protein MPSEU_000637100 [Mayamaea pseudoterrestris]|nr:hypothetical protein MPSEU_000637100 [Mayamaea pseudoterrestris]
MSSNKRTAQLSTRLQPTPSWPSSTTLNLLLDVPDGFFTITFPMLGIILSFSKSFARVRMEENAWEQRLAEGRRERLERDPTLTEIDLRRQEADLEWSAYGKPRMQEKQANKERQEQRQDYYSTRSRRVKVKERNIELDDIDDDERRRDHRMTDLEIEAFEMEYGVEYDPYYDDPYSMDELPEGSFTIDKRYGDRVYDNGEIFYRDAKSGLYYRQGAKPRGSAFRL